MPIYNIQQLRDSAPAEFRDLPPEDLVRQYSQASGVPFQQAADYFGVAPRGTFSEVGRQLLGGAAVDLPKMGGQLMKYVSEPGQPLYETGQSLVQAAEARAPQYAPDLRGRGLVGEAAVLGARAVAPMAPAIGASFLPGGQWIAPTVAAGLFGTSSAQETYEKLVKQGVSEEDASAAARRVGLVQGPLEGVATAVGLRAARPLAAALGRAGTTAGVAGALTETSVARPFLRGMATNLAVQPATEVAQDVGTEMIERAYGATPEDIGQIARQSALGGAGLTMLLGPFALGGSMSRARRAQQLSDALYGENATPEVRAAARLQVTEAARQQGVAESDIGDWLARQLREDQAATATVADQEKQLTKEMQAAAKQEPLYADIAYALRDPQLAKVMSEQDRTTLFAAADALRSQQLTEQEHQDTLDAAHNIIASYMSQEALGGERDLTTRTGTPALFRAPQVTETPVGGLTQVATNYPVDLTAYQAPTGLGRQPTTTQPVPGVPGVRQVAPGIFTAPEQLQQVETRQPQAAAPVAAPVVSPPSGAPAVQTPAAPAAAGVVLPKKTRGKKAGPVAAGQTVRVNDTDVTLNAEQAAAWNAAQEAYDGKVRRAQAITNYQERESQLRAAGMQLSAERRKITGALTSKEKAATVTDEPQLAPAKRTAPKPRRGAKTTPTAKAPVVELDTEVPEQEAQQTQAAIDELGLRPLAEGGQKNLQASVRGGNIAVSGKASIGARALAAARNAFLGVQKTERKPTSEAGKLAAAAKAFGAAYDRYMSAAGAMVPTESESTTRFVLKQTPQFPQVGEQAQADARATRYTGKVQQRLREAQTALAALGEAAGNNAKNVETMVRVVKDEVGRRKAALQAEIDAALEDPAANEESLQDAVDEIARLESLDFGLASGWAAAKRGVFRLDVDKLDVRGGESRTSTEEQQEGAEQPLERAAKYGEAVGKSTRVETGFQGVLNYIRNRGTPFERMIAKGVTEVFRNTKNPPKLVFTDDGRSEYDPNTNTVFMSRTASPEVALHEALHAALQWYVHSNPKNPMVVQLLKAVDKVIKYDTNKLSEKAAAVQKVLTDLKKGKRDLDAVLELISYGNTLVEFRKALEAMPTKGEPTSFVQAAKDVWNMILATVRRMLNVPQSVASDVIMDSFKLLEEASRAEYKPAPGQVLEAATQTNKPLSDAKAAAALGVSEQDYSRWSGSNLLNMLPTQRLFEAVGWSEANAKKFVGKAGEKFAGFISKNFPGAEIALGLINSRYAVSNSVSQIMDRFKLDKGIGYQYAEDLANVISRRPAAEVNAVFAYLDGNKKALDNLPDADKLKAVADKLKEWFDLYVAELSDVEQRYFKSRKFTETLLFPERTEQVAGGTFGLGKINEVLGLKRESETELDQDWFTKDANGDLLLDGDMYQVFKVDNTVKPGVPEAAGFMSAARFAELNGKNPMGYSVDTSRKWLHEGASDQGHSFITNTTARDKVENEKADDVANALRNTIAALANNYASKHFIKSVYDMGRGDNAHAQVAFDSLADVNKAFGTTVTEDKVLKASYEMSRSPQTKDLYRMSGTWVQLPESGVYGELAGKLIPGPVWNAMVDMSDRQPLVNVRAINNTMRWFKKSKTVWNPGTHVTNAASNVTMAMLHDISFGTMRDAAKYLAMYEANPKSLADKPEVLNLIIAFRDSGAMLADYSSAEVKEALYKAHADNLRGGEDVSVARRVAGWMGIEKSKAEWLKAQAAKAGKGVNYIDDLTSQLYAAEDNVFRLAAFLKTVGTLQKQAGLKAPTAEMLQEAGQFARKAFGDYDIDSKAVKVARQTVMPFISWFYAMAPVLGRIAVYQPWKLANVLAAYMLLEAAMGGGDDEELRKQGPESIRERMFFGTIGPYMHVRIPFMGDDQNPVYYKLGDYFPMASMTKGLPNGFMGQSWFPGGLTPSGPFVSGIAGLVLGVDPYTGKSIHKPTDTDWDKLWNATKFGYDIVTPPAISSRQIGKVDDIIAGKTGITGAEPSMLPIARTFGLKLYDFNVDEQAAINEIVVKRIQRDFKSAITKATRDEMRKGYPDYEALDAELEDLRTRMEKEIEKARGGSEE